MPYSIQSLSKRVGLAAVAVAALGGSPDVALAQDAGLEARIQRLEELLGASGATEGDLLARLEALEKAVAASPPAAADTQLP